MPPCQFYRSQDAFLSIALHLAEKSDIALTGRAFASIMGASQRPIYRLLSLFPDHYDRKEAFMTKEGEI